MGASHPDMDILQKSNARNFMTFYLEKLFVSVFMMAPEPTRNWSNRTVFTIQGLRSFERDRKPKTSRCCARVWRRCGASSGGSGLFPLAALTKTNHQHSLGQCPRFQKISKLHLSFIRRANPLYFCTCYLGQTAMPSVLILFKGFRLCLHSAVSYPVLLQWLWLQLTYSQKRKCNGSLYASCFGPILLKFFSSCLTCVPGVAFGRCKKNVWKKQHLFVCHHSWCFYKSKVMEKSFGMASKWTLDSAWDCTLSFSLPGCVSYKGAFSDHITWDFQMGAQQNIVVQNFSCCLGWCDNLYF